MSFLQTIKASNIKVKPFMAAVSQCLRTLYSSLGVYRIDLPLGKGSGYRAC